MLITRCDGCGALLHILAGVLSRYCVLCGEDVVRDEEKSKDEYDQLWCDLGGEGGGA